MMGQMDGMPAGSTATSSLRRSGHRAPGDRRCSPGVSPPCPGGQPQRRARAPQRRGLRPRLTNSGQRTGASGSPRGGAGATLPRRALARSASARRGPRLRTRHRHRHRRHRGPAGHHRPLRSFGDEAPPLEGPPVHTAGPHARPATGPDPPRGHLGAGRGWGTPSRRVPSPTFPTPALLDEIVRRRRAAGGPAEKTSGALVGLELPRRLRDAVNLFAALE